MEVFKPSTSLPRIPVANAQKDVPKEERWLLKAASERKELGEAPQYREPNPFRRSSMIVKFSPISAKNDLGHRNPVNVRKCVERRREGLEYKSNLEESSFILVGAKIVELSEFIKDKHNVHQAIKHMVKVIKLFLRR